MPKLGIFGNNITGILTGFQRTRLRATYGIEGSIAGDFVQAICCQNCTLMQNDREIRAREGQVELQTNKKYQNREMISAQPRPNQPMRYASPRPTSEPRTDPGPSTAEQQGYGDSAFQAGGVDKKKARHRSKKLQKHYQQQQYGKHMAKSIQERGHRGSRPLKSCNNLEMNYGQGPVQSQTRVGDQQKAVHPTKGKIRQPEWKRRSKSGVAQRRTRMDLFEVNSSTTNPNDPALRGRKCKCIRCLAGEACETKVLADQIKLPILTIWLSAPSQSKTRRRPVLAWNRCLSSIHWLSVQGLQVTTKR